MPLTLFTQTLTKDERMPKTQKAGVRRPGFLNQNVSL
jgi:hypothetical protein